MQNPAHKNRLKKASSPYLQQHANNPVDWYEWGEEALQKAKKEDKPLLVSIGYSACHWCHVMERESFMDQEVADYMNAHFVSVKVDREERPDIDKIYIDAAQMLNGNAGWPLNAFALPDGKPFWIGLYFGKQTWMTALEQLHKAYTGNKGKVEEQAEKLTKGIGKEYLIDVNLKTKTDFKTQDYKSLFDTWENQIDFEYGGLKSAQKFPMVSGWEFMVQYSFLTKNKKADQAVETTLKNTAYGGIYDQLGGGFSRYATDEQWFAPHFEKMLYDNAQLVSLYSQAYRWTKNSLYKTIIEETLAFVQRELTNRNGGFYSALNADSEGEEGKFYVWKNKELDQVLNQTEAEVFKKIYNCTAIGNWEEGNNILYRTKSIKEFSEEEGASMEMLHKKLKSAKDKLMKVRSKRIRPSTDDKILVSWNALMIKAYTEAYRSLGNESYLKSALDAAEFIRENMQNKNGVLFRNYKDGKVGVEAFLDDYAFLAEAFIALYQVTFKKKWLQQSKQLTDYVLKHFKEEKSGMFYYTSDTSERLIARKMDYMDNELPSSNATLAKVLFELGHYFDNRIYLDHSLNMLSKIQPLLKKGATYFGKWTSLLGNVVHQPYEIAIMGGGYKEQRKKIQKEYLPIALFMGGTEEDLPLLEQKSVKDKTKIYVCQNKTCQHPVEDVQEALKQINL